MPREGRAEQRAAAQTARDLSDVGAGVGINATFGAVETPTNSSPTSGKLVVVGSPGPQPKQAMTLVISKQNGAFQMREKHRGLEP